MKSLMNILYMAMMKAIRVWRMVIYAIIYIGATPIKAHIQFVLNAGGVYSRYSADPLMIIHNDLVYQSIALDRFLGLGESYMAGWWDCKKLDVLSTKACSDGLMRKLLTPLERLFQYLEFGLFNMQTINQSSESIGKHYDLGNEFFKSFLDKSMAYTCAYWKDANNLDEAQQHKMELIGRKLKLKPGMRVLDLGCGWGGMSKYLAETYNVEVVGVTISKEDAKECEERCKGLKVEVRVQDYRDVNGVFDRIVVVGFIEHVGRKNYRSFYELANRCLSDDGILLVETIGHDNYRLSTYDRFINKYIFPNCNIPDHKDIPASINNLFCIEDWHNFGPDYDKTLMAWHENFVKNWHTISHLFEEPDAFYRMWTCYLLVSAGFFRARGFQLWQIVMTKWLPGGYISVR